MRARRCARMKTLCSVVVIACITTVSALSIPIRAPMKTPPARISAAPLSSWSFHRDVHSHRYTALTMVQGESRGPRKVFFRGDQVPATWLHVPATWRGTVLAAALHHESTFGMIDNDSSISEVVTLRAQNIHSMLYGPIQPIVNLSAMTTEHHAHNAPYFDSNFGVG